jgi:predicted dehydrogenase
MKKIRWGILGVAKIATAKVIPAMQQASNVEIAAIASRDINKAKAAAGQLRIPQAYGSYEELLADPSIDAIYNPLPNHLHVPWSIRAAEAGKHVLCEKPIGLSVEESRDLIAARDKARVKIGEAFMARTHPQWLRAAEIAHSGRIGELRVVSGHFSYFNRDPKNVRNIAEIGGGGIMDIGCYPITLSRMIFGAEPVGVHAFLDHDPDFKTDRLASVILQYPQGHASFTCSTQLVPYQKMHIFGTTGHIEIEIPFNAPPDKPTRIFVNDEMEEFPVCDQYTIQGELFSRAILENTEVPVPLEDALKNMMVIEKILAGNAGAAVNQSR